MQPREEREAAYRAAASIAGGRPTAAERAVLARLREEFGLGDVGAGAGAEVSVAARPAAFQCMVRVAAADGPLSAEERDSLRRIGRQLGLPLADVDWVLQVVSAPPPEGGEVAPADTASLLAELTDHRRRSRLQRRDVSAALAAANFVPFMGILIARWSPVDLLHLYGFEMVGIAMITWARVLGARRRAEGREGAAAMLAFPLVEALLLVLFFTAVTQLADDIAGVWAIPEAEEGIGAAREHGSFAAALLSLVAADAYAAYLLHAGRRGRARATSGRIAFFGVLRTAAGLMIVSMSVPAAMLVSWIVRLVVERPGVEFDAAGVGILVGTAALGVVAVLRVLVDVRIWSAERETA